MTPEQLLPWLLGPTGLTVGLLFAVWKFQRGDWVAKERLDEMRDQRDAALALADKAVETAGGTTRALEERNRLEAERLRLRREGDGSSLSADLAETEHRIRRRTTRG